jgi:hypothetical protein
MDPRPLLRKLLSIYPYVRHIFHKNKFKVFLNVTPCCLVVGAYILEKPGGSIFRIKELYGDSRLSVCIYQTTWNHITEDHNLDICHNENLKSHKMKFVT